MRIHCITAGAASMYCGSCIRDNALAAELIRLGHDVLLVPLYTPTLTDEENVSQDRVFFGGLSIYLEQKFPFFRSKPRWLDRISDSSFILNLLSRISPRTDGARLGELTVSMLKGEHGFQNKELRKLLDWLSTQPRPDVVSLPFSLLIALAAPIKRALNCAVSCTLQGEDLFLDALKEPHRSQALELIRSHLPSVDLFIAVSQYYADFMTCYLGIPREKIQVVPLGINLTGYPHGRPAGSHPFTVGYFARVAPEKGLDTLCQAYRILRKERGLPPSRLEVAGYLGPSDRSYLRGVERQMKSWGLAGEFRYHGVLSRQEKIRFLQSLSVLSVPSSYVEPKGIYLLEAMACGVPVVQPHHGAFPEIIEKTAGGLLFIPGDTNDLALNILTLYEDRSLAARLGRRGFENVRRFFGVQHMAARMLDVYNALLNQVASSQAASLAGT